MEAAKEVYQEAMGHPEPTDRRSFTVIPIDDIIIGERFRNGAGDIEALASSVAEIGLLHPPVVTRDLALICGYRRIQSCKSLGWTEIPVRIMDINNALRGEYDENALRVDFLPSEMVAITEAIREQVEIEARQRQLEHLNNLGVLVDRANYPNERTTGSGRTNDILAKRAGTSRRTLEKARTVVQAAQERPEYRHLVEEMDSTGNVDRAYNRLRMYQRACPDRS